MVQSWLAMAQTTPRLDVAAPSALPGDTVELTATLTAQSMDIAGVKADIFAPSGGVEFLAAPGGGPDCTVDPALDKLIGFNFLPPYCQPGVSCTGVQVIVFGSPSQLDPIPNGTKVFQCAIRIADDASGVVPLTCDAGGQSTGDLAVVVDCAAAGVVVEPTGSPTHTASETPTDTPSPTPTLTAPPTDTASPTDTVPPGSTATITASSTATATETDTASPTDTVPPGSTATATASITLTATETDTASPTGTPPPGSTSTATASITPTAIETATDTPTAIATATNTPPNGATATASGTPTATPTATSNASPTATMPPAACLGDCAGTGQVTIDDLIRGVNIALGIAPISNCPAFDPNDTGQVTIATLIEAVNNALTGCP